MLFLTIFEKDMFIYQYIHIFHIFCSLPSNLSLLPCVMGAQLYQLSPVDAHTVALKPVQ